MAKIDGDFDEALNAVQKVKDQYDSLKLAIGPLQKRKDVLTKEVFELGKKSAEFESVIIDGARKLEEDRLEMEADIQVQTNKALKDARADLEADRELLATEQAKLQEDTLKFNAEADERQGRLSDDAAELARERKRLDKYQEELQAREEELVLTNENQLTIHDRLEERTEALDGREDRVTQDERSLEERFNKAEEVEKTAKEHLQEAQARLNNVDIDINSIKERERNVGFKEDEMVRREALLTTREKELKNKEIALNDRQALYNSY